ncbi:Tn3 family transposase [Actinopolyspora saharensis]|uniref:Tn3 family transposase n=1 Tax=Actinopolyspora saharensis TaxID=995062 RepID=UPI003F66AED6
MEHLRRQGDPFRDEELARLPPLGWQHINLRGRYAFTSSPPGGLPPTAPRSRRRALNRCTKGIGK